MTNKYIEKVKKKFEANLLDGDKVNDCGGAMLSAESVWSFIAKELKKAEARGFKGGREYASKNDIEF